MRIISLRIKVLMINFDKNKIMSNLSDSLREFGIAGTVMITGGTILLVFLPFSEELYEVVLLGAIGFGLILLSIINSYFGLIIHKKREELLINMVEHTCNRLAEQLSKENMTDVRSENITQKIRQTQEQIINAVYSVNFIDSVGSNKKKNK